jgi:multimeric flavodoxin WrbA
MKRVIVQGSSRSIGNTNQIALVLKKYLKCDFIDLNTKNIGQYDYKQCNRDDDFLSTIREIVEYDLIIFITPVYWYAMSGIMKTFFDRITDCLKIEKETGRKLRGKNMAVISCGSDNIEIEGFFTPFKKSAEYLGMNYSGNVHTWIEENLPSETIIKSIEEFANRLK